MGWIGWIIIWIVQLGLTGLVAYLRIVVVLTKYVLERIPVEVVDFACYHFIKSKSEEEVRRALAEKGWSDKKDQDEVFDAIGGLQNVTALNRIK
ncbi:hypothetical protein [Chryseobacterium cheonjiense]|uniref:hypothetical protein n=1 Tax=Chryseobacterium cheonjiense TaxID=2728845 RepID=UPI001E642F74|nr:hypothetical protein [Chryseobacterium cheonjiense]